MKVILLQELEEKYEGQAILWEAELDHIYFVSKTTTLLDRKKWPNSTINEFVAELTSPGKYHWSTHVQQLESLRDGGIARLPTTRTRILPHAMRQKLFEELKGRLKTASGAEALSDSYKLQQELERKIPRRNAVAHGLPPPEVVEKYVRERLAGEAKGGKISEGQVKEFKELVECCRTQRAREAAAAAKRLAEKREKRRKMEEKEGKA
ncbi:hypothetical protein JCM10296v2_000733 [Rhodotorula toruloides]